MKKITMIAITLIVMVSLLSAFEGNKKMGERQSRMEMLEREHHMEFYESNDHLRLAEELELTEEQLEDIENFRTKFQKEMIELNSEIKKIAIDKRNAMKNHDFAKMRKLTEEFYNFKQQIATKRIEQNEMKWDILTEEQKEKAEDLMKIHHRRDYPGKHKMKHPRKR